MNWPLTGHQIANRSFVRSADHDSQDKNLVGSLDQFAKMVGSGDRGLKQEVHGPRRSA